MPRKNSSEVARTAINDYIKLTLWGIAAGRCELCNCPLYEDGTFGVAGNFAEVAHIHAVSLGGPRNVSDMTEDEKNRLRKEMGEGIGFER